MDIEQRISIKSSLSQVFSAYEDVAHWSSWDPDVLASSINGNFEVGTTGKLKPAKGPELKFVLVEVTRHHSFTAEGQLPLCTIRFEHELAAVGEEVEVVHRVLFSGVLAPLFKRLIGSDIAKGLPATLIGLNDYVRSVPVLL